MRIVMKFGGTSVGSVGAIQSLIDIVRRAASQHQVAVVVSAMSGVTDTLVNAARSAADSRVQDLGELRGQLLSRHIQTASQLISEAEQEQLVPQISTLLTSVTQLCEAIGVMGELTPRALDVISGQGERCSVRLVAAALRSAGISAQALDATELILTDERFNNAGPLMVETRERSQARVVPLLERGAVPVVTGFIGATAQGITTTLGRGGSDYSAAILGAAVDADEIWIWTDVDGVMTTNPKVVPEARTLPTLSYSEMAELAYYGAKVLHPKTVLPAVERGIPIRILNTFNPSHPGTAIVATSERDHPGKAVTAIRDVSMITVSGRGMLGLQGIAARIFGAVARAGANTLLITQASSEQNVCLVIPRGDAEPVARELRRELAPDLAHQDVDAVDVIDNVVVVAVVGAGMRGTPGIAAKVFGAVAEAGINVIAIAQGSAENNISLVVSDDEGDAAVRAIHRAFEMDKS
jgi:aspartate kinase